MSDAETLLEEGRTAHRAGQLDRAASYYREALTLAPTLARAKAGLGIVALQTGRIETALAQLEEAARQAPQDALIQNNLGNALMAAGQINEAERVFENAVAADPALTDALYNRAVARQRLRRRPEAEADYRAVLARDPSWIEAAVNLAALLRESEDPLSAIQVLTGALAENPANPDALLALAGLHETVGQTHEADRALAQLPPGRGSDPQAVLVRARLALRRGDATAGLTALEAIPPNAPPSFRRQATYIRGLLLDRANRYSEAFAAFREANTAMRESRPDADVLAQRYRSRIARYRQSLTNKGADPGTDQSAYPLPFNLVFFCGFPRSGTTLMEQILAAHPQTMTTGEDSPLHRLYETLPDIDDAGIPAALLTELSPEHRDALRRSFVELVESQLGTCNGYTVVDKLPLNLVELGIVAKLFPEARILVAIRDPRDCVLSAFMQPFRLNDAMACLLTLEDAAALYADVFDLYAHQKDALALSVQEYRYEDLIDDFDGTLRSVIGFLGLEWTDDVTRYRDRLAGRYISTPSYMAVTRTLNRQAIGRWTRYRNEMAPILPGLERFVRSFGYDS